MSDILIPEWTLGERLTKARKSAGLDPTDMAERLGVSDRTIRNWEQGVHRPKLGTIRAYAQVTGVALWWLEGDGGNDGGDNPSSNAATDRYLTVVPITPHDRPGFTLTPLAA